MRIKRFWTRLFRISGFWISPFWIRLIVFGVMAVCVIWAVVAHTRVHFNRTDSSPYHAFVCVNVLKPAMGEYASIEGHQADYFGGLHYTKKILGVPGDVMEMKNGELIVGGRLIGTYLEETSQGLKLTPQDRAEIPVGFVFVAGEHPRSFDSRYKEFGLVAVGRIKGRCFGVGKRQEEPQ